jgi:uncharacterized surface protein with fasciclin (FAS1) repeats
MKHAILAFTLALGMLAGSASADGDVPSTVVDAIAQQDDLATLATAIQASGFLFEVLSGEGPFTVFAPTDAAFLRALARLDLTEEELLADEALLNGLLAYHVLMDAVSASDLVAAIEDGFEVVETGSGAEMALALRNGLVVLNGSATVVTTDLEAENGVVHIVDRVLVPPSE